MPGCAYMTPPFPDREEASTWFRDFHHADHPGWSLSTIGWPDSLDHGLVEVDDPESYKRTWTVRPVPPVTLEAWL